MKKSDGSRSGTLFILVAAMIFAVAARPARGNVYATDVRLNGELTKASAAPGASVAISYILNEPASLGVTIDVLSGVTVVRSLAVQAGSVGAMRGFNSVAWDGLDRNSNAVPLGTYTVRITAATSGHTNWTAITDDSAANAVYSGRGIAVVQNPHSAYYGRIFVANTYGGPSPGTTYGDNVGVLAFNGDASVADPDMSVTGGFAWSGNDLSPFKVSVSSDDFVYASELIGGGLVYRWDAAISTNSFLPVLRSDNRPGNASLRGPFVVGSGTNTQIWMCDTNSSTPASRGVLRWTVTTNGTCATNDTGITVVGVGGSLTKAPSAVATDPAGNIYICQYTETNTVPAVFRFPAYNPATNSNLPELTADWAIGSGDDTYGEASGIAVDPTGTYVAVAFVGTSPEGQITNGNTKVFYATNGALVTSVDLGVEVIGIAIHQDTDCAWDAVGNLYYIDYWNGVWRAISPPGTNQSVTTPPVTLKVAVQVPPQITSLNLANGTATLDFTAGINDTPDAFTLQSAADLGSTFTDAAGVAITQTGAGHFRATVPVDGSAQAQFYRLRR